ncbi:hypothetical protein [Nocardia sp. NPDC057440]|uniref:hypothetical protein n=1 Tax=Nocardia sp. NPDC057440 TaxID=3346134 RepID=UPI00366B65AB
MTQLTVLERQNPPDPTPRLGVVGRWGVTMARHRRIVLTAWLLLVIACASAYPALHAGLGSPDYSVPGSDSVAVDRLVAQHFARFGTEQDLIVFHSAQRTADSTEYRAVIDKTMTAVRATDGVAGAIGPYEGNAAAQISPDRQTAVGLVGVDGGMTERVRIAKELQSTLARQSVAGVEG